jgi:ADP-heptose:LPS heptosyltransferase
MMKLQPEDIKKIAVFRALQLGDVLCAIPAIRALRKAYPKAKISFIGLPNMRELINRFRHYIDDFIEFPGHPCLPEQPFNQYAFTKFVEQMIDKKFDLILQMHGNGTIVNQMLMKLGSRYFAGFNPVQSKENPLLLTYPNYGHEINRHLALMEHLGLDISTGNELEFPIFYLDMLALQTDKFSGISKKYICIHPGSRGNWRQWPPLYFATIGNLCTEKGFQVVITGTTSEVSIGKHIAELMKDQPLILSGKTNLGEAAAVLKNAHGLVANCTGVSHLAAALKIPSVIISMDGEPDRWAPMNYNLHKTIDWTTTPDYDCVAKEVSDFLLSSPITIS